MPIPLQLRITNLEERLDVIEVKQRVATTEDAPMEWTLLERDRLSTLRELGKLRGLVGQQEARHLQREDIQAKTAYGDRHTRFRRRSIWPGTLDSLEGPRKNGKGGL